MVKKVTPPPDKTIFTASEACGYIGLCWNTLKRLINDGKIRTIKVGRKYLIPKEAIDDFVNREAMMAKMFVKRLKI